MSSDEEIENDATLLPGLEGLEGLPSMTKDSSQTSSTFGKSLRELKESGTPMLTKDSSQASSEFNKTGKTDKSNGKISSKYGVTRDTCANPNSYAAIHKKLRSAMKDQFYHTKHDPNLEVVQQNKKNNELTLPQIREIIEHVCEEYDESSHEPDSKKKIVTMEYQLYDFLRKHYGLKSAIKEKAGLVFRAIRRFAPKENDVAVFGKILMNTLPVSFQSVQELLTNTALAQLRQQVEHKNPRKPAYEIDKLWASRQRNGIPVDECTDVIRFMYNDRDSEEIIHRVEHASHVASSTPKTPEPIQKDHVRLKDFLHVLLTYQMNLTESHLSDFTEIFNQINEDGSGILTGEQLQELVRRVGYVEEDDDKARTVFGTVLLDSTTSTMAVVRRYKKGATFSQSADLLAGQISARWGALMPDRMA